MNDTLRHQTHEIDAHRFQIGIIGDPSHVEGSIHFHASSPSPADFTGRTSEPAQFSHAIEQEDVAERLPERALQKNADLTYTTTRV